MSEATPNTRVCLLPELVEHILSIYVDSFHDDPAYQWTSLRHISSFQKTRIERRFYNFWLRNLTATAYIGPRNSFDYVFDQMVSDNNPSSRIVHFQHVKEDDHRDRVDSLIRTKWAEYELNDSDVLLRLGEGVLNRGLAGGYIISNVQLPGFEVDETGFKIQFDWREAFTALLREEMLLRRHKQEMLAAASSHWRNSNNWPDSKAIPNETLLRFLVQDVQMSSRIAVLKYRLHRQDPTGHTQLIFNEESKYLHRQEPNKLIPTEHRGGCFCCSRRTGPDIFEVISQEESMVLALPDWQDLNVDQLKDLYDVERAWQCCVYQGCRDDVDFQQERLAMLQQYRSDGMTEEDKWRRLKIPDRWDILG